MNLVALQVSLQKFAKVFLKNTQIFFLNLVCILLVIAHIYTFFLSIFSEFYKYCFIVCKRRNFFEPFSSLSSQKNLSIFLRVQLEVSFHKIKK